MTTEKIQAPKRVIDLLTQASLLLQDAQAHADKWDRSGLGRTLDPYRWQLVDLLAAMEQPKEKETN